MKRILSLVALIACLFSTKSMLATHAAGAEIVYELVAGTTNTYLFTYKFYRDCAGAASAPTSVTMCINSNCGTSTQQVMNAVATLPGGAANGSPVSTGCPGFPTTCTGGALPGYEEWWYTTTYTIPTTCSVWKFSVSINARNNAILNLFNPGAQSLYVEAVFDNTVSQNNNSPYFSNPPIPYCCINQPFSFNNGVIDVNGDSLHFESIQPRTSGGSCTTAPTNVNYVATTPPAPPFTPLNPFPTGGTYTVDPSTGSINFTATATGAYVITILVSEYRNGVFIGSVMRDLQIVVQNCSTPSPTYGIDTTGIDLVSGVIQGCAGDSLNFCFNILSTSPIAILVPSDNSAFSTPGANIVYSNTLTDSIYACFSWLPTNADTGLNVLTITVKDSSCTPPGILVSNTFSIPIYINPVIQASNDTSICLGDNIALSVNGGNTFHWTVLPGGDDTLSMSCTYCDNPTVSPSVTTSYVVTSDLISLCSSSSDTVTVTVAEGPSLTITPDTVTCINANLQLNVSAIPAGVGYDYVWSPTLYLNDPTISNPIMQNPANNTTYTVTVIPQGVLACSTKATVFVEVLKGFDITSADTVICNGSTVNIQAVGGDPKYTYAWTPTTYVSNPSGIVPSITPTTPGTYTYTLTLSKTGCPDSSQAITITANPIPDISAGNDREICQGDTSHINLTVNPPNPSYTYAWSPAADLNNASIPNPIFDGKTSTMLQIIVSDSIGCSDTDLVLVTVNAVKFINIVSGNKSVCPNDSAFLSASGAINYLWRPGIYTVDSLSASTMVFPISTTDFMVYGYNAQGCLDSASTRVVVHPGAILDAGANQSISPGESAQLYADGNCSYFSWFPPNGLSATNIKNPIAQPSVTTRYFVTAQTEVGCTAYDSVDVIINPESFIDVPNAFSPGSGTSINDEFKVVLKGTAKLNSFKVFNRWGQQVFSTNDITKGWNGQYNGKPQPLGSYVYVVDAISSTGKRFYKQGNVTLVR